MSQPDYVQRNRNHWDKWAHAWVQGGERNWTSDPAWGMWCVPETDLGLLPDDMSGMRAIELGCGTGYVSSWMVRRGASVVGIDNSVEQLATARRLADEHGVDLELIHGLAEDVPYPDESFDFAISEYGAAIWSDPALWVPEAVRLLRPGGRLVFLGNHPFVMLCQDFNLDEPATRSLTNPYFGMYRIDWDDGDDSGTEFNMPISDWMKLFDRVGFDVVSFHELRAPRSGPERLFFATYDWAHDFPSEQVWVLQKRSEPVS